MDQIIGTINDPDVTSDISPSGAPMPASVSNSGIIGNIADIDPNDIESEEDHYGSFGQQALTGIEGAAQGFAGPLATGAEKLLSKAGVPGLSPEEQAARAEANPITSNLSQAVGFGAGAFTGTGEAALLSKVGEAAVGAARLGEATNVVSKIAETGIRGGAELAALQAGDEASKFINQDPNQTLGSAAVNVGLSSLIGVAGGAFLGSIKPAVATTANKLGLEKLASDYMGEMKFLQDNPDMVQGAAEELSSRMNEVDNMRSVLNEAKPHLIAEAMPEVTPKSQGLIDDQLVQINDHITDALEKAANSVKTQSAVPYISEDWAKWNQTVTNPGASFSDKFLATNNVKRDLES